jgi:luciferase family oxidoreductase group 1
MKNQIKVSVLDLCPQLSGVSTINSFLAAVTLAQKAEELGLHRYWLAEHHNMEGIGSSSPEVLISHIAAHTKNIRVGSGGIMLPNHSSLHIAEVFKTLSTLYPNRIDLGIGRAPGSGSKAAAALRGHSILSANDFPQQLDELLLWLNDEVPNSHPGVLAVPTNTTKPETWILGSSDFGAMLAGHKGLPYSFAQHFSQLPALEMIRLYREYFQPSKWLAKPHSMIATHIICAETDEKAQELALSSDLSFSLFVQTGKSIPLPTVTEAQTYGYTADDWRQVRAGGMPKFVGSPETIKRKLLPLLDSGLIDELMVLCMVHDQTQRLNSYEKLTTILNN